MFQHPLLIITAPSGAGKTTIVRHLLSTFPELGFSISATTRQRRPQEINGRDYYFLTPERFEVLRKADAFLEWEEVYEGQFYGSLLQDALRLQTAGKIVVFDIDVQGAQRLKMKFPDQTFVLFIAPPSLEILIARLKSRGTESEESLTKRINRVTEEMTFQHRFDHVIVNDELERSFREAESIATKLIAGTLKPNPSISSLQD